MNEDDNLMLVEEIEEKLEEWGADEAITVTATRLFDTTGASNSYLVVQASGPHTEENTTSGAELSNWVEAFVNTAGVLGYEFKDYCIEKVLTAINTANIEQIEMSADVVGMALSVVFEVQEDLIKITVEILECYQRVEELSAEEASERELGDTAGEYVTGTDTDVMVATTVYSVANTEAQDTAVDMTKALLENMEPEPYAPE